MKTNWKETRQKMTYENQTKELERFWTMMYDRGGMWLYKQLTKTRYTPSMVHNTISIKMRKPNETYIKKL